MTELLRAAVTHQLTLSRAHAAARAGDLDLARALLDSLGASDAATLDLRARVHAQRGEFTDADKCWEQVLSQSPSDKDAIAGRAAIARIVAGGRARPVVNAGRAVAVAAAVVGTALVGGVVWAASSGPPAAAPVADTSRLQEEIHRADTLQQKLSALDADQAAAADKRARQLDSIASALAMPGVQIERRATDVRVVFDAGVFRPDVSVTPVARGLLTETGRRLAGMDVSTTVVGHAVAVTGGRSSGGSTVALSRAQVAAGYLAGGGKLTGFTLATADQSDGPFPDAARNRTVTLVITPRS